MLVRFTCDANEDITMLGDDAVRLIHLMGHSGTIPSAILAEDVPKALEHLKEAVAQSKENNPLSQGYSSEERGGDLVSLANRAFPLIEMLENAKKSDSNIMWDKV